MKNGIRIALLLAAAAAIAVSCSKIEPITAPALAPGRADFSVVAALGTGITAGFQSGGLVNRHQTHSYVSLFAEQVHAHTLDLPLINLDGFPPLFELKHLYPPPIQIGRINSPPGDNTMIGLPTAYHNMGIPDARLQDVIDATRYSPPQDTFFSKIQRDRGTLARQVATQIHPPPTFLLFEFGTSEILGPALDGTTPVPSAVADFARSFGRALDTLAVLLPNTKLAVLNVPDVTGLPFFTTVSNKQLDRAGNPALDASGRPKFLLGPFLDSGGKPLPLGSSDLVLLSAQSRIAADGFGYPTNTFVYRSPTDSIRGNGEGLIDSLVITNSEALTLQDRAQRFNSIIDTTSRSTFKPRDFAIVDLHGLLSRAKSQGIEIRGVRYTTAFVTGGLIGLDGLYLNDLGHALLCNEVIRAVNAKFGAVIQPVDPLRYATLTSSRAGGARE